MMSHFTQEGVTSYKQAMATSNHFKKALPGIMKKCEIYPVVDFVDAWPASLRQRLIQQL